MKQNRTANNAATFIAGVAAFVVSSLAGIFILLLALLLATRIPNNTLVALFACLPFPAFIAVGATTFASVLHFIGAGQPPHSTLYQSLRPTSISGSQYGSSSGYDSSPDDVRDPSDKEQRRQEKWEEGYQQRKQEEYDNWVEAQQEKSDAKERWREEEYEAREARREEIYQREEEKAERSREAEEARQARWEAEAQQREEWEEARRTRYEDEEE